MPDLANRRLWSFGYQAPAVAAALGISVAFCYSRVLAAMAAQWWSNDMYSYGILVPWISLYMVWFRREALMQLQPQPCRLGGSLVLTAGLLSLIVGQAGSLLTLQELSLLVTITGIVLLLLGRQFLRRLWFPIAYLLFMIPIWNVLTDPLHAPFQQVSARLAASLMQGLGVPVYHDGIYLTLPTVILEVAAVCSGVNYLVGIVGIGLPLTHLFLEGWTRKLMLLGLAVVVAALANSVRVALIGVFVYYGIGGPDLHGPYHILQALSISLVGYGVLFAGVWVLSKAPGAPVISEGVPVLPEAQAPRAAGNGRLRNTAILLSGVLFLVGVYMHVNRISPVLLDGDLANFPRQIGSWIYVGGNQDPRFAKPWGADQEFHGNYRSPTGRRVDLYIGYYESQRQGRELVSYRLAPLQDPRAEVSRLRVPMDTGVIGDLNRSLVASRRITQLTIYWFDVDGRTVASPYLAKLYTTWDALVRRRTSGALIVVSTEVTDAGETAQATASTVAFIETAYPHIRGYLSGPADRGEVGEGRAGTQ